MNKEQGWRHTHPITILFNVSHYFYLIVLPVARGFILSFSSDFQGWLSGAWFDLLVVFVMVMLATLQWWFCRYRVTPEALFYRQGLIFTRYTHMPWSRVISVIVRNPFYLKPVKACLVRFDTLGGSGRDVDLLFYLSAEQLSVFHREGKRKLFAPENQPFRPKKASIVFMSIISNTSFLGVIYLAAFIYNAGRLFGNQFSELVVGTVESFARQVADWIPPSAAVIAAFLLLGWLVGFTLTLFRFYGFRASRVDSRLTIQSGLFSRHRYSFQADEINYIDIRQNIVTFFARLYTLSFSAAGCLKTKNDLTCLIPLSHRKTIQYQLHHFFPNRTMSKATLTPKLDGFLRYVGGAFWACVVVGGVFWYLRSRFERWSTFLLFVGIMVMIPLVLFLLIRFLAFFRSGMSADKDNYTLSYSKWFTLHTIIIPKENLSYIVVYQSIWQRFGDTCDLWVFTQGEGRSKHICRGLKKKTVLSTSFLQELQYRY